MVVVRSTVRVSNIPFTAIAKELFDFFEVTVGKGSVFACEIATDRKNWKSRGVGRIQFETIDAANTVTLLSNEGKLLFRGTRLSISPSFEDIIVRPIEPRNRFVKGILHVGFLVKEDRFRVLESWESVKAEIMPERQMFEFWVYHGSDAYKLGFQFGDVFAASGCRLRGRNSKPALLLTLKYAPKLYQKVSGPDVAPKFSTDRYHLCKEDFEFLWVRKTDFTSTKAIGHSSTLCWELEEGLSVSDIFTCFPYYKEYNGELDLEIAKQICYESEIVPLVKCEPDSTLRYEILFQINSLIHSQKISLAAADIGLFEILQGLTHDSATMILQKLHKMKSTCYYPLSVVHDHLNSMSRKQKNLPSSCASRIANDNIMSCHRILVTPSKVYCMGPELETSNYVVKHYAEYASDFLRVSFVEEDWSKLSSNAISTSTQQGIFSKPFKTKIYHRILSILRDGIVIGAKRFEFLAFSASQLRSNSVWMFASNAMLKAEDIREWMGCFNNIRSVSKCAARMGQLFSSSLQTVSVPAQDVEIIPDIEVTSDGIRYCFSDGIGKIALNFARQIASMWGLSQIPSAFQIRYGGYKGVVAVDRNSFRKLSLRHSMLKFDSTNRMLNVTKWSESMPCYLNREIVSLLSTLGVENEKFEMMQQKQMRLLDEMLTNREAALEVLEGMGGGDIKSNLVGMLMQGYEPNVEPYLSMMLKAYREFLLSDIRSRCRIFVPKGRVLMGCLDETGTLDYGQVYIRVTMTRSELQCEGISYFQKVDDTTSVVVGKVIVTKNPCLHPGDIRVLDAVYEVVLEGKGLIDCLVFPQKGERPHPNECSGGDLDGDLFFVSWDEDLIPCQTDTPMDYIARRSRVMDHDVTLEEIQKFFVDYMINDTLGVISTAHLVHADREESKARSPICLQLANLHSMAVDFAKTGAPAEMPRALKPKEYPDFMERGGKPMYISNGILGKLYRATINSTKQEDSDSIRLEKFPLAAYDHDLEVNGFEAFVEVASSYKKMYLDKLNTLINYYGAESEEEILLGNLRNRSMYLQWDKRRYGEMKDRILLSINTLQMEAKSWFKSSCKDHDAHKMASAWYHVTYHPDYCWESTNCLSFPWIIGDVLLNIKSVKVRKNLNRITS